MTDQKTLIFVGAHPDDETLGLGGTLAQYARAGVKVYYACGTRGEAGEADPEFMKGFASKAELRWTELTHAGRTLGLADVIHLGYRDSGMPGSAENKHPQALINAPPDELAERIVKVIRQVKPQVVITFDPEGGYRHPDHISIHNATVRAFTAAGDAAQFPDAGPAYTPQKLYYHVFSRRLFRIMIKFLPLFGQDPHHFGRNKDIDLAAVAAIRFPIHARIRLDKQSVNVRDQAIVCHASQVVGMPRRAGLLGFVTRLSVLFGESDAFMRAQPPVSGRTQESDLFEGVSEQ